MKLISLLIFSFLALQSTNANVYFCDKELGKLPILQGGRVKPLYVHSKEMLRYMTGKTSAGEFDAVTAYCLLSLKGLGLPVDLSLSARADHVELREFLNLKEKKTISLEAVIENASEIRMEMNGIKEETAYKKSLKTLLNQGGLYRDIVSGQNWKLPEINNDKVNWVPLTSFLKEEAVKNAGGSGISPFLKVINNASKDYDRLESKVYKLEYKYAKAKLPVVSLLITLLALASLTLFKNYRVAYGLTILTIIIQTTLIVTRVFISGRAPITNMYETVMFSGYGALILSLIVGFYRKEKTFVYVGLMYNMCTLMMMNFATSMLSESISPLVPVLRDNFWLSTHVTTIILSYGALALSWILANTVLVKSRFSELSKKDEQYYSDLIYSCLKYGTIMLGAGIILGGVWADYSWGRFWGWDPKETWSLIAFCFYIAILHGKNTNWIPNKRFIPLTALAFMSIMMAWFGVNYILASGLHSYGFSEGGAIFLGCFFLIQILMVILTGPIFLKKNIKDS